MATPLPPIVLSLKNPPKYPVIFHANPNVTLASWFANNGVLFLWKD